MEFLYAALRYRSLYLNLLFLLYLLTLQPSLLETLRAAQDGQPHLALGLVFLLIPLLELAAFYLKRPVMTYYVKNYPGEKNNFALMILIFVPLLHLGAAAMLFIAAAQIGGFQPADDAPFWPQMGFLLGFFATLGKEGLYLAWWFSLFSTFKGLKPYPAPAQITLRLALQDAFGDLLLLVYSTLAYTALWDFVAASSPLETGGGLGNTLAQFFGVLIYFSWVFFALRGVYAMTDAYVQRGRPQIRFTRFSYLALMTAAFFSIPRI